MRFVQSLALPMVLGLLWTGCGARGHGRTATPPLSAPEAGDPTPAPGSTQAPTRVLYSADPAVYTKGVPIAPNVPFVSGGFPASFRLNAALPKGLTLDPATGIISGTPATLTGARTYQVTVSNGAGSTDGTLTLSVNDQGPTTPPVLTLAPCLTSGRTGVQASVPDQGPGATYAWALTGGTLTGGQGTSAITLTAGAPGVLKLAATVGNSGGTITGTATSAIVPVPEASLTFPLTTHPGQGGLTARVTPQPGMTYAWEVLPGTGTATLASGQGTSTVDLTAGPVPGVFQLRVQVRNQAGDRAVATATIQIKP